jgi:hypothetical protein
MLDVKAPVFFSPFLPLTGRQQTFLFVPCSTNTYNTYELLLLHKVLLFI